MSEQQWIGSADGERLIIQITQDADGDYIVRDHTRPGCVCHEATPERAFEYYLEVRRAYDDMKPQAD